MISAMLRAMGIINIGSANDMFDTDIYVARHLFSNLTHKLLKHPIH